MTAFRDGVGRLADRTEAEIAALFTRFERGQLGRPEFVALAAALIARARVQGVGLADLVLTSEVIRALRTRAAPLGLTPPDGDAERLQGSVTSVLDQEIAGAKDRAQLRESQRVRLIRLGRDSAAESAVWAYSAAMVARGARGWIRVTDANPCQVCSNLADGVVRSPSVTMKRHTGCCCTQSAAFV